MWDYQLLFGLFLIMAVGFMFADIVWKLGELICLWMKDKWTDIKNKEYQLWD